MVPRKGKECPGEDATRNEGGPRDMGRDEDVDTEAGGWVRCGWKKVRG